MKSILMSIKPQWVVKILNDEKSIEIRKRFPSDYVGWVYIYCTKGKTTFEKTLARYHDAKVVARFWCDRVEEITTRQDRFKEFMFYETSLDMEDLCKQSCLEYNELDDYLYGENGYAIHITKLEIFDTPKELSEFWNNGKKVKGHNGTYQYSKLTRAPQSFCFIEV